MICSRIHLVIHHGGKVCHQTVVGGCFGTILFMAEFVGKIVSKPTPAAESTLGEGSLKT